MVEILFKYKGRFWLGQAGLNSHGEFYIYAKENAFGPGIKTEDVNNIRIIDGDNLRLIDQNDLYNLLCSPPRDQNDREIYIDDYIASIQDNDKLIVYQVRSISTATVNVKVVHDSHCPMLSIMRDNIASSWAVIPFKKN